MTRPAKRLYDVADESVKSGLALFTGDVLSTIILAIGSILIARFLGPEGYGLYSLSLVIPTIMLSLIALGIDHAVIRFPAKLKAEDRLGQIPILLKSAIAFRFVSGLVMWLICFLLSDILATYILNRPEIGFYIKISSFLIIVQSISTLFYSIFIGLGVSERGAMVKVLMSIIKSTLAPALIIIGLGITGAVTAHVLSYFAACLAGIIMLYEQYRGMRDVIRRDEGSGNDFKSNLRLMIGYGLPLYTSSLLTIFMDQYRLLLLAYNVSNLEIGNFQAAGNFLTLLAVISMPIALAIFPAFSKLEPSSEDIKKAFQYSVKYTAVILVPASVFTIMMSRPLVEIVYGHQYVLAPIFLSLYAATYLYSALGSMVLGSFFNGIGETMVNFKATLLYFIIFIPLATILTSLYGVIGLITSVLISLAANVGYCTRVAVKRYYVKIDFQSSAKILSASLAGGLVLIIFLVDPWVPSYPSLLLGIPIYLITYITLLPLLGGIQEIDLENLNILFRNYRVLKPVVDIFTKYEHKLIMLSRSKSQRELR
ncbi:MAG: oligosaccharide flippase family protein [Nitrososphaerota archaeon]